MMILSHVPNDEYFEFLKVGEGGAVHLCDNMACKARDIGTIRLKIFNDREFLVYNVTYVPELKKIVFHKHV